MKKQPTDNVLFIIVLLVISLNVLVIIAQVGIIASRSQAKRRAESVATQPTPAIVILPKQTTTQSSYTAATAQFTGMQVTVLSESNKTDSAQQTSLLASAQIALTATAALTQAPMVTDTAPPTLTAVSTPSPTLISTSTSAVRSIFTPDSISTATVISTFVSTATSTPTAVSTSTATATPTSIATSGATSTATATSVPVSTATSTVTSTGTASLTDTQQPLAQMTPNSARVSIPNTHYVSARTEPSASSEVVSILDSGAHVLAVARTDDNAWLQILLPTGERGWISTKVVIVKSESLQNLPVYTR
ncbi:MAG: SH3 domain-containing protein [Chloroflexota bacterium]